MGDIANMTDYGGYVNGFRLLRWLRSRAEIEDTAGRGVPCRGERFAGGWHAGRADLLQEMADDLEAEINPPDYPEDDDEDDDEDDKDTWPCEGCGKFADRVLVQENGRAWFACPACAARVGHVEPPSWMSGPRDPHKRSPGADDEGVDLDDTALTNGPEQGPPEGPAYRDFAPGREDDPEAYREMVQQERAEEEAGLSIRRRKQE